MHAKKWFTLLALLTVLAFIIPGCAADDGPTWPSGETGVDDEQAPLPEDTVLATAGGLKVTVPAEVEVAGCSISPVQAATVQFPSKAFKAVGEHALVTIGVPISSVPLTIEAPLPAGVNPDNVIIHASFSDVYMPLPTTVDRVNNTATAALDLRPLGSRGDSVIDDASLTVGTVDSSLYDSRPPHVDWPSYNVYIYTYSTTQQPSFVKFIDQGKVLSTPDLGARPLMLVHGLGGGIHDGEFDDMARYMHDSGYFTSIIGFEYDTLARISRNGGFLRDAITVLNAPPFRKDGDPKRQWCQLGHSMGTLTTRTAFEMKNVLDLQIQTANVVLLCSPSLGSQIAVVEQSLDPLRNATKLMILSKDKDWVNADGTPCKVTGNEDGFTDLRPDSDYTKNLNVDVSHPQAVYRVLAGGTRLKLTEAMDTFLLCWLTDGLVDLPSATTPLMNFAESTVLNNDDHFAVLHDAQICFPAALMYLQK